MTSRPAWIIEGSDGKWIDSAFERADLIIILCVSVTAAAWTRILILSDYWWQWIQTVREAYKPAGRYIGDFSQRKAHDAYQKGFGRLLRDFKARGWHHSYSPYATVIIIHKGALNHDNHQRFEPSGIAGKRPGAVGTILCGLVQHGDHIQCARYRIP